MVIRATSGTVNHIDYEVHFCFTADHLSALEFHDADGDVVRRLIIHRQQAARFQRIAKGIADSYCEWLREMQDLEWVAIPATNGTNPGWVRLVALIPHAYLGDG